MGFDDRGERPLGARPEDAGEERRVAVAQILDLLDVDFVHGLSRHQCPYLDPSAEAWSIGEAPSAAPADNAAMPALHRRSRVRACMLSATDAMKEPT